VELIKEALRVTKTNGVVLFSSYSNKFWDDRLDWFKIQSDYKLVGEIDFSATKTGIIACKDGFVSNTITEEEFRSLCLQLGYHPQITEIDKSSVFCVIKKSEK
jgi:2-polyprenyl-6-hydroxyphenyl methylase/3-demethylubiquinone-9 3-methyltransferase